MIRATEADVPAILACLEQRPELAMFPQNNLVTYGLDGEHDYAPSMWIARDGNRVTDVLTLARNGSVMPFLPSGDLAAAAEVLAGRKVTAVIGPAVWARPLIAAARLGGRPTSLDRDEPQYGLDLADLNVPDGPGTLRPLQDGGMERMAEWYVAYDIEALGSTPEAARKTRGRAIKDYVRQDSHRVLLDRSEPLSITGFNAALDGIVQIGGVYTPPDLRGRGHARRAVALHLAEARARGVGAATLFAANEPAARAYEAIGFGLIGRFTLCLFKQPERVLG